MRGYIDLLDDNVMYAGGLRHLLVAYPAQRLLTSYSLQTLKKLLTIPSPVPDLKNLAMGYSSPRYALLTCKTDGPIGAQLMLFDVETMDVETTDHMDLLNSETTLRASSDGSSYGFLDVGNDLSYNVVSYKNRPPSLYAQNQFTAGKLSAGSGSAADAAEEARILTPAYLPYLKQSGDWTHGVIYIPSCHPSYYLSVSFDGAPNAKTPVIDIYTERSETPLVEIDNFQEMTGRDTSRYSSRESKTPAITPEKRFYFYPQLNLFITIPASNDRLMVRHIDLKKIMDEKGTPYFYVDTIPPVAKPGERVHFTLNAMSSAGGVVFALQSGPPGLTVSSDGVVDWQAPARLLEESVIVSLKDKSGKQMYHTFKISVTNQ